ncbi:thiocyanate methyltransferase 1-like [Aristolochia californica]|uniref:thiocyanate methyltransferase 1-like n=1 Tax=Aristolochia californica TaxID=171875 RepID=UPI0035D7E8C8
MAAEAGKRSYAPSENPNIVATQEKLDGNSTDGWDRCWEQGITPWDVGHAQPIIVHLLNSGTLPKGRALIPGCGSGYDVVAIASPERFVVGLDVAENAIKRAKELSASLPNANCVEFLLENFFAWKPAEQFDLIFDYTFFAAVDPSLRPAWGSKVAELLKPDGELITLISPISNHVGGPPYGVSVALYEQVLHPLGFEATLIEDNEHSIETRKGLEKLGRWKRSGK